MAQVNDTSAIAAMLRKLVARKKQQLGAGLKKAGLFLQRESMKIVPVDYGFLKASAFTRATVGAGGNVVVTVGYTSAYAVFVHEVPPNQTSSAFDTLGMTSRSATHGAQFNAKHAAELAKKHSSGPFRHNRGPDQQYKFLETPFRRYGKEVKAIIMAEVNKP